MTLETSEMTPDQRDWRVLSARQERERERERRAMSLKLLEFEAMCFNILRNYMSLPSGNLYECGVTMTNLYATKTWHL